MVAVTNPTAKTKAHGISLFLVEEGMPGFKKGRKLKKMGLKAQDTAELFFEDVRLPASALLGKENHGFYMLMQVIFWWENYGFHIADADDFFFVGKSLLFDSLTADFSVENHYFSVLIYALLLMVIIK